MRDINVAEKNELKADQPYSFITESRREGYISNYKNI
jgi:hypothetical protein